MRKLSFAGLAAIVLLVGCARPPQYNVMFAKVVCDTLPPPLRPGERVGGTLPTAPQPGLDSVLVIGMVLEARSGRPMPGASVGLLPNSAPDIPDQSIARALTNSEAGFVIVAPGPGRYSLVARRIGSLPARLDTTLAAGTVTVVRLEMHHVCAGY